MAASHFETPARRLPQRHAYHLIYRHGLEVAPDGQTLAMGSTTGSFWCRATRANPKALSRDLPPVYCGALRRLRSEVGRLSDPPAIVAGKENRRHGRRRV